MMGLNGIQWQPKEREIERQRKRCLRRSAVALPESGENHLILVRVTKINTILRFIFIYQMNLEILRLREIITIFQLKYT